jgi:phenylacetate-CoA ligase
MSGGQTEKQVRLIVDLRPDVIMVTPSYVLAIADEFDRQGVDARACSLSVGIHGAEPWTEAMRREIEARFDMHAVDIYGLSEVMGPGVASECVETKDGLHVPGTARTMRRMTRITGRSDDMLIVRGVNVFPSQIEEILLGDPRVSAHYQLELRRDGRLDELTIVSELKADATDSPHELDAIGSTIASRVKDLVGVSAAVRLVAAGGIERSLGKAKRVIDLRH